MRRVPLLLAAVAALVALVYLRRGLARAADDQGMGERLTRLAAAEDSFHAAHHRYADRSELTELGMAPHVQIAVIADSTRYVALATSSASHMQCIVWAGSPRPATAEDAPPGVPKCWTP